MYINKYMSDDALKMFNDISQAIDKGEFAMPTNEEGVGCSFDYNNTNPLPEFKGIGQ